MSDYICTKKCYRGGKLYKVGEEYIGDTSKPIPSEFKAKGKGLTAPKRAIVGDDATTFFEMSKKPKDRQYSEDQVRARRALGHKDAEYPSFTKEEDDPFEDLNAGKDKQSSK